MTSDSTLYTIGTALNRARDNEFPVEVLVAGSWISGMVVAVDGHGVVINSDDQHAVVRVEAVCAVKIVGSSAGPVRTPITVGAHAMPGPRSAQD